MNRREFIRNQAGLATGVAMAGASPLLAQDGGAAKKPLSKVRVGFVGIGVKGSKHLGCFLNMENVEVRAVCDILEGQCIEAQKQAERLGKMRPTAYFKGPRDFERMCQEEELDLVYTATPWRWHVPVSLAAMENGKHAATEVPAALTIEDCWKLIEVSEKTGKHCAIMENVNYQRVEMTVLKMIRQGLLGDLVHGAGSYLHDTRYLKAQDHGDGLWLGDHHAKRNGSLYPTHGIGPMAWYMDLNCGDRPDYLVSMSSAALGMNLYAQERLPEGHPKRVRKYVNGDVNTSLIKTVKGRTITIVHDTDLPRPYSRTNLIQGTRGIVRGFPNFVVSFEDGSDKHKWKSGSSFLESQKHPLWEKVDNKEIRPSHWDKSVGALTKGATWLFNPETVMRVGDFLENYRLVDAIQNHRAPDMDVYDAATWSAVAPLSERSVANRSTSVDFPDFTRGKWKERKPLQILGV